MKNDFLLMIGVVGLAIFLAISNATNDRTTSNKSATSTPRTTSNKSATSTPRTTSTSQTQNKKPLTENQIKSEIRKVERSVKEIKKNIQTLEENKNASVYKDQITMQISGKGSKDPIQEYVILTASTKNKTPIKVTGFELRSLSTNRSVTIGKAFRIYFAETSNALEDVYLKPGEKAYIVTGVSPMRMSFQINKCSGYHSQFYSFAPSLPRQCPRAEDEKNNIPTSPANDTCFDFIERFPQCKMQTSALPETFGAECRAFILDVMNYKSCVTIHKNDADFYSKQWRVYLGRDEALWKTSREAVILLDAARKTVDTVTFN